MMVNRLASLKPIPPGGTGVFVTARRRPTRTRRQSLQCAVQGLRDAWDSQPNLRIHVYVSLLATGVGFWFHLALIEWLWISFAIGLVIFAELMNTAIEQTVDLAVGLAPDPLARQVKDIAAGCVLVSVLLALVIGVLTFGSHFLAG